MCSCTSKNPFECAARLGRYACSCPCHRHWKAPATVSGPKQPIEERDMEIARLRARIAALEEVMRRETRMSELAWRILALFLDRVEGGRFAHVYLAGWTIRKLLMADCSIDAATILHGHTNAQNECERAMRELVDKGLIEEMPDLGERWRLVVKGEK